MPNNRTLIYLLSFPLILFLLSVSHANSKHFSLSEVNLKGVTGKLGHRLGSVVTIEGIAEALEQRSKSEADHLIRLKVTKINQKKLNTPIYFPARPTQENLKKLKAGDSFKFLVYETGEFTGTPSAAFNALATAAAGPSMGISPTPLAPCGP